MRRPSGGNFGSAVPVLNRHSQICASAAFGWVPLGGLEFDLVNAVYGTRNGNNNNLNSASPFGLSTAYGSSGNSQFAFRPLATSNGAGTGDYTIACVALLTSSSAGALSGQDKTSGPHALLTVGSDYTGSTLSGAISIAASDGTSKAGASTATGLLTGTPTWYVIVGVVRGGGTSAKIYVNGVDCTNTSSSVAIATISATGQSYCVGGQQGGASIAAGL